MSQAEQITARSKSNLAFAFIALPESTRRDITTFYAFCRQIDDAADNPGLSLETRKAWLRGWRSSLRQQTPGEPPFAPAIRDLARRRGIPLPLFDDILDGVEMDLAPVSYETFEELAVYCYRVASAVGLVSIEIFGYRHPATREYARQLGLALQLTNIIRDVQTDLENGRVYLPAAELTRFGYSAEALRARTYSDAFVQLMQFQANRARRHFAAAQEVLPKEDVRSMVAAEGMRRIYHTLLVRMERDRFQLFRRRYRLSQFEKFRVLAGAMLLNRFNLR